MEDLKRATSKDGTAISYVKRGTGRPMLFVHGTAADHRSWSGLSPLFDHQISVHAMDRRGRGVSGDAPDYDIMREAEDVVSVVEAIGEETGEPVVLFGHSFGGLCALEAALMTDEVSRLILYEPMIPTGEALTPPGVAERIQALVDRGDFEAAMELMLRDAAKISEHELEAYRRTPLWTSRLPIARTVPRELASEGTYRFDAARFAGLDVPTMLLLGGDSPEVYRKSVELVDSALPESDVVILPGQQHLAHHTDPELFAREVLRFLSE